MGFYLLPGAARVKRNSFGRFSFDIWTDENDRFLMVEKDDEKG